MDTNGVKDDPSIDSCVWCVSVNANSRAISRIRWSDKVNYRVLKLPNNLSSTSWLFFELKEIDVWLNFYKNDTPKRQRTFAFNLIWFFFKWAKLSWTVSVSWCWVGDTVCRNEVTQSKTVFYTVRNVEEQIDTNGVDDFNRQLCVVCFCNAKACMRSRSPRILGLTRTIVKCAPILALSCKLTPQLNFRLSEKSSWLFFDIIVFEHQI